jgi:hypothetical protein
MPGTLPSQVLRFIASVAVMALLTAHPAAAAPQKPAPPPPTSPAQLEARVKDLETRLAAAEQKADKATMEKEYILRTQNHYEAYYKEVFSTQTHILWTIGVTVTLISITFSVVFFVAGRFGFNIFDRRIDAALRDATAQLRTEFAERLANETNALQQAHAAELKVLEDGLAKRISQQEEDLTTRSRFQFDFAQGLAAGADQRPKDARAAFRRALTSYKLGKARQLIPSRSAAITLRNLFVVFPREDEENFLENAKKELADEFYDDLEDELAQAALTLDWLGPLLKERKPTPSQQTAAEPKIGHAEPANPAPAPDPKKGK